MSTAIARIYTPEGFVVAADGRTLNAATGKVGTDTMQKIFPLHHEQGDIACVIAGSGQFFSHMGEFTFGAEVSQAALAIARTEIRNPDHYAGQLAALVVKKLEVFKLVFQPASLHARTEATHIWLEGYLAGRPMRRKITLAYQTETVVAEVSAAELDPPGKIWAYGSQLVTGLLFAPKDHGYLTPYWKVCQPPYPATIEDAVRVALAVIRAHCDEEAIRIDSYGCAAVGGRILAAKVTPAGGFEWVQGFAP